MAITWSPCSNGATRHRARGGNLVGGGKRFPIEAETIEATDVGRELVASDVGLTLTAEDAGRTVPEEGN